MCNFRSNYMIKVKRFYSVKNNYTNSGYKFNPYFLSVNIKMQKLCTTYDNDNQRLSY